MRTRRMPTWLAGIVGGVSLIALWWLMAVLAFRPQEGTTFTPVPTPWAVFEWLFVDGNIAGAWGVFQPTITAAAIGYVWGNGIALILVLGTSGAYHTPSWSIAARRRLMRLDHSMIYVLIAGSYAPFAFHLESVPRTVVLSISIGGGLIGWIKVHAWPRAPRMITSAIYVVIGWCMAPYFPELYASIGPASMCLLLVGGIFYTGGAVIYWLRFPNPWPRTFGYHEVNHLLGLVGATCHYIAIWSLLT